jgi:7,8-dihydro-6-hydroxymethylpterin-pyrophosphokinase
MAQPRKIVTLSLGSNLGDRKRQIERAVELLDTSGVRVARRSSCNC